MYELGWSEWVIGLIGVWLVVTPCLLALNPNEGHLRLGLTVNVLLAGGALAVLGWRALLGPRI